MEEDAVNNVSDYWTRRNDAGTFAVQMFALCVRVPGDHVLLNGDDVSHVVSVDPSVSFGFFNGERVEIGVLHELIVESVLAV